MAVDIRSALVRLRTAILPHPEPPPASAGYPMRARDYLQPQAAWPLVFVADISGWSEEPYTNMARFTLTHGMRYTQESATFQCHLPLADADLFGKRGAYLVILMPTDDEAQVKRVLAEARRRPAPPAP